MTWSKLIGTVLRVNAGAKPTRSKTPKPGQVIFPRREDSIRDYPGTGLTPSRLMAILKEADAGSPATPMQLFEEMEEKDPHLYAVANTRRLAITGLDWEIVSALDEPEPRALARAVVRKRVAVPNSGTPRRLKPAARGPDRGTAQEAADYCREVLAGVHAFPEMLQHLSLALGRNIAIGEIIWDVVGGDLRPVELIPIDFTRIVFDEFDQPRILTQDNDRDGIELAPNKFIVHTPHNVSGHPQRGGLLRVTAMAYLAKNLALKDWMIFAEVFGMPVRIARYEPTATAEEKRELIAMLESLGSNAAGIFSRAVELQVIESKRAVSGAPYERLIDYLNREISKAWLGQTLTTDITGQSGSIAAARVHETVRRDILVDDLRKEARTIRRDLLGPMTRLRFGPEVPVPLFRRRLEPPRDLKQFVDVLGVAVNQLGVDVPADWVRSTLGIPDPGEREAGTTGSRG